jgi:hypothetical protein
VSRASNKRRVPGLAWHFGTGADANGRSPSIALRKFDHSCRERGYSPHRPRDFLSFSAWQQAAGRY